MSRSRRKKPIRGVTTARSEKQYKRKWHRRLRQRCKVLLKKGITILPSYKKFSDPWLAPKDGKVYFDPKKYGKESWFRKILRK